MLQRILSSYKEAFSGIPRPVWWLCFVSFANRIGAMAIPFMALYLTHAVDLSVVQTGSLLGCFGIGAIVGGYSGGWLAHRYQATRVQTAALLFEAGTLLILAHIQTSPGIGVALFFLGFFNETFRPANAAAMIQHCEESLHARAFSLNRLAMNLGASIGPAIGGFLAMRNYQWLFYANALTCFLASVLVLSFFGLESKPLSTTDEHSRPHLARPVDFPFFAFLLLLVIGLFAFFQIENTLLVYLKNDYHLAEVRLGLLFSVNTLLVTLFEMVLVHALRGWNPLVMTGIGFALICGALGMLPYGSSFGFAVFVMVILTFGEMLALPFSNAWVAGRGNATNRSIYLGMYYSTFGVAVTLAPVLGTRLYQLGPAVPWHTMLAIGGILLLGFPVLSSLGKGVPSVGKDTVR